jgi:hypothetical protein
MQTSKAIPSPENKANAMPATREAVTPMPTVSSQPSLLLTSRPALPSLFSNEVEARAISQSKSAAPSISPGSREGNLPAAMGDRRSEDAGSATASTAASGSKRTRDGKDGPARKESKADKHGKSKPFQASLAKDREAPNPNDAESNAKRPGKRARKDSKSTQSGKADLPKSADQGISQTDALSPPAKVASAPTLSHDSALSGSDAVSPGTWKHGAQSPRASGGNRASLTLSPRRSSNASASDRVAFARQGESAVAGQQAKASISAPATLPDNEGFTFAPCDSDEEGVICVKSGSRPDLPGKDTQTAPGAAPSVSNPGTGTGTGPDTEPKRSAAPGQQTARQQPGLTSDLTELLDELDTALDKPIGM